MAPKFTLRLTVFSQPLNVLCSPCSHAVRLESLTLTVVFVTPQVMETPRRAAPS